MDNMVTYKGFVHSLTWEKSGVQMAWTMYWLSEKILTGSDSHSTKTFRRASNSPNYTKPGLGGT